MKLFTILSHFFSTYNVFQSIFFKILIDLALFTRVRNLSLVSKCIGFSYNQSEYHVNMRMLNLYKSTCGNIRENFLKRNITLARHTNDDKLLNSLKLFFMRQAKLICENSEKNEIYIFNSLHLSSFKPLTR